MARKKDELAQYSSFRGAIPEILIASLAMNILSMALPLSLLQIYDRIIPNTSFGTLLILVLGVVGAVFLEGLLRVARGNIVSWIGTKYEHRLGCAAFERILNRKRDSSYREAVGDTLERMSSLRSSREYYSGQMVASLMDLPFVFVFLGMIYLLGGPIVWVPVTVLVLFGIVSYFYGVKLRGAMEKYNTLRDRRLNFQIEILNGIHSVKSLGMEGQMEQRYSRLQDSVAEADQKMVQLDTANQHISFIFAQITMVAVAAYGSTFVVSQDITIGVLAACTLLSGRAVQPFQRLTGLWTRLQSILIARTRLKGIFDIPVREDVEDAVQEIKFGKISFRNMTFAYGDNEPLFKNLTLDIPQGTSIGIVGGNGSGKTTLLSIMGGVTQPTHGGVFIDNIPVEHYSQAALSGSGVAYLPQNGEVFNGTILENLTMFNKAHRQKALSLAEGLGLDEVVARMSNGYETVIGNTGADALPCGIRQRISIARALVKSPKIILFDEANAAIDGPGDVFLREYLETLKGKATLILVSSRPSLLRICDQAYDIEDKTLKEKTLGPTPAATNPAPRPQQTVAPMDDAPQGKEQRT